ncbi:MAG TPA: undecaprenyl-diphosphate phosphatase [Streptosporangiaceae bacterium]|nr:undecaprenyl-diphosphate phosphatase [Streptosporangiaceae bacterium]
MSHLTYLEAGVVGLIQGVSEMFPVSSLGHNVLIPALVGGQWAKDLNVSAPESPYLAFIVGLHVATAIALIIYFWRDWIRIIGGLITSIRDREIRTVDQKLAWMIVLATIPVGLAGLAFEHTFRVIFGQAKYAAVFLILNGIILIAGERYRSRSSLVADMASARERERAELVAVGRHTSSETRAERLREEAAVAVSDRRLSTLPFRPAILIGSAQILALFAGISRDGVTMVAGMVRGLSREDAARFAFLLATPVILAAGALKIPDLFGPLGNGIRGQIFLASILSGTGAYLSVRFLVRYLRTRTLTPFGVYCLVAGVLSLAYLTLVHR